MMRVMLLVGATLFGLGLGGAARAETYDCTITADSTTALISPSVRVNIIDPAGDVRIEDAITTEYLGGWARGKIETSNAKRITIVWVVRGAELDTLLRSRAAFKPTLTYRLTVRPSGAAVLTVNDAQNRRLPSFRGEGSCRKTD